MDLFLSMEAFVRVAELGSFSKAARQLHSSKSVITTRVKALETTLEVALFHRSTRAVRLSEVGQRYYQESQRILADVDALRRSSQLMNTTARGLLRLHVLPGVALSGFAGLLRAFRRLHPNTEFDVTVSDHVVDPVEAGVDLSIQIFAPASEDLVQRQICNLQGGFCAAPSYLASAPALTTPADLAHHDFASYAYPWGDQWQLQHPELGVQSVKLHPMLRSNSIHLVREFASRGDGVAYLPWFIAADELRQHALVRVLPGYSAPGMSLSAVYPASHRATAKVKLFLDFLCQRWAMLSIGSTDIGDVTADIADDDDTPARLEPQISPSRRASATASLRPLTDILS